MLNLFQDQTIKKLKRAIEEGDTQTVSQTFKKLKQAEQAALAPELLSLAITTAQPAALETLLSADISPNTTTEHGTPSLLLALEQSDSLRLITPLLQAGANTQGLDLPLRCLELCRDETLMMHLNRLQQHGVDLDIHSEALFAHAAAKNNAELIKFLVQSEVTMPSEWPAGTPETIIALAKRCEEDQRIQKLMLQR